MNLRAFILFTALPLFADGPADNLPDKVRPVPPPGINIHEDDRKDLTESVQDLREKLQSAPTNRAPHKIADVWIFHNAVDYALRYDEFLGTNDVRTAEKLLRIGHGKADELLKGGPTRSTTGGGILGDGRGDLVVHGYTSKIDGSIQPYGLVIPSSYNPPFSSGRAYRLDAWFHGRDEKLTELKFLNDRLNSPGEFTPPDTFVLHLYGRYCNANKFAGEIDLFEALADVKKRYPIDEDRIVIRGFSMGGAACWQFAVHYPGEFAAAAPGAGFAETKEFLRIFQNEPVAPPPWEQKLWHWYDCPDVAVNLFNLPTVAYSGEIDKQKQAADIMAAALARENIELTHIIGPKTAHKYHPVSKEEINERIDALAARGRDPLPRHVKFATYTLRYNKSHWITLEGLEEHWKQARIDAELSPEGIRATTENITALSFNIRPGLAPFSSLPVIKLDNQEVRFTSPAPSIVAGEARHFSGKPISSDRSWTARFRKIDGRWAFADSRTPEPLRKRPGLQGPIDDAFMDSFIIVLPTRQPIQMERYSLSRDPNRLTLMWARQEAERAVNEWRRQFRGEARVILDRDLTPEHVTSANLILWGNSDINAYLNKIADRLPIRWANRTSPTSRLTELHVGDKMFDAGTHLPLLIYPNPENPNRYIVLNSGFTFREYDYLNNARQIAKLPDYAIIDITTPPNSRYPGKIITAGFFNESWQLK